MILGIAITGIILGFLIGQAGKFYKNGYGYSNDIDNQPVLAKTCFRCNERIPKSYVKNLCPKCGKPLE